MKNLMNSMLSVFSVSLLAALPSSAQAQNVFAQVRVLDSAATGAEINSAVRDVVSYEQFLERKARSGSTRAMLELGRLHAHGEEGFRRSTLSALHWFERAAAEGDDRASLLLGALYTRGLLVNTNSDKAYQWLETASRSRHKKVRLDAAKLMEELAAQ